MINCSIGRVVIVQYRVDFRRRFDGLLAESYALGFNPFQGDCLVFVKKDRTQLRVLFGDSRGLYLVMRRFESGRLSRILSQTSKVESISLSEVSLLLEGASFTIHKRIKSWQ